VNYRSWSFTTRAVLASKDLIQHVDNKVEDLIEAKARELSVITPSPAPALVQSTKDDGTSPSTLPNATDDAAAVAAANVANATKELKLTDAKAMALIIVKAKTDQLSYIATATTAYKQWHSLQDVYEPTGPAQLAALLAAFHGYTLRPSVQVGKAASDLTTTGWLGAVTFDRHK
jgi:gag-polypeptide of LTR copia-type